MLTADGGSTFGSGRRSRRRRGDGGLKSTLWFHHALLNPTPLRYQSRPTSLVFPTRPRVPRHPSCQPLDYRTRPELSRRRHPPSVSSPKHTPHVPTAHSRVSRPMLGHRAPRTVTDLLSQSLKPTCFGLSRRSRSCRPGPPVTLYRLSRFLLRPRVTVTDLPPRLSYTGPLAARRPSSGPPNSRQVRGEWTVCLFLSHQKGPRFGTGEVPQEP